MKRIQMMIKIYGFVDFNEGDPAYADPVAALRKADQADEIMANLTVEDYFIESIEEIDLEDQ
jgi:hypothetical protein